MILNVSGRTDIVAFYTDWFMNRYKEGYVDVRNPYNPKLVSRIRFKDVDAILFCTKNPKPILNHLNEINKPIIFHVTLTPYKDDIEPNVPLKTEIIESIKQLSQIIGIDNLYIRYDPIFINNIYSIEYHIKAFERICFLLNGYVKHIIVSFIDIYKNVTNNMKVLKLSELKEKDYEIIGLSFSKSATKYNITVQTCFEKQDLTEYGFIKGECISHEMAYKLTGKTYKNWTARKERLCNCVQMVDIGAYNSCKHYCKYCYANFKEKEVYNNYNKHDKNSTMLIGKLEKDDIIKLRTE